MLPEPERDRPCDLAERTPPWRIGWLGLLRCAESFEILLKLAQRRSDVVITLRGRPVPVLQQMIDAHLPLPNMRFDGCIRKMTSQRSTALVIWYGRWITSDKTRQTPDGH